MEDRFNQNEILIRDSGPSDAPAVIYAPGIHGDWTPLRRCRKLFQSRVRLIELSYPRRREWRLKDYAAALDRAMDRVEVKSAHLAAESFGSLVGWQYALTRPERVRSLIIVGGFTSSPGQPKVMLAKMGLSSLSPNLFEWGMDKYCSWIVNRSKKRQRALPQLEPGVHRREIDPRTLYPGSRTPEGWKALISRLDMIQRTDFRPYLNRVRVPVRYLGGEEDAVVPVHREVRTLTRALPRQTGFQHAIVPNAPHMVIASHPRTSVETISTWVEKIEAAKKKYF